MMTIKDLAQLADKIIEAVSTSSRFATEPMQTFSLASNPFVHTLNFTSNDYPAHSAQFIQLLPLLPHPPASHCIISLGSIVVEKVVRH